ncbi:cell division protein FtsA [Candidatus Babeliales bacterium]|nr:cell division protein FtsA [Candidatus Babeliales bacterium]
MARIAQDTVWTAIDIGTTKICVLIAQHLGDNTFDVLGFGKTPSEGLSKGVVVDIAKTVGSIKRAVQEAELMAGMTIDVAHIGVSGAHIKSLNSHGVVPIKRGEVRHEDIQNVIASAQAVPVPEGQQILHVLPQYFVVDGQEKVQDPLGMYGIRLEAQVHIITGSVASVQNLIKCCEMAGVRAGDIVLEQLASAEAVLTNDERELGVAVLDIGGGTSDLALYQNGSIRHTMVLPIAGNHFTNDLAIGLHTTLRDAERVKREHGLALLELLEDDDVLEVEMVQGNEKKIIFLKDLVSIIQPRSYELLSLVHEEVIKYHLQAFMRSGLVLTGGGSLLRGMKELAEELFEVPVRIGVPSSSYALPDVLQSPVYATAYGLLVHVVKKEGGRAFTREGYVVGRILDRMKSWVSDFF